MRDIVLENAAESFCNDVQEIARQYREEAAPISAKYNEMLEEAKKLENAAHTEYRNSSVAVNQKYAGRIYQAAQIRGSKAERPEQIDKAARTVVSIMGGHDFSFLGGLSPDEAKNARRVIENAERKRLEAEERESESKMKKGTVL